MMTEENKAPMTKETVQLEDGRYLIYYNFGHDQVECETKQVAPADGKGEGNV